MSGMRWSILTNWPFCLPKGLVGDLVDSICFARGGVSAGKLGVANGALAQQIFLSDVGRALERAGLPVKRWRKKYDLRSGESFFFRLLAKWPMSLV